jgi:flagellar hook protein FlgE
MLSGITSATNSIRANLENFNRTAERIARTSQGKDLARNLVQMMIDKRGVQVNTRTLKAAEEMTGTLLDVIA